MITRMFRRNVEAVLAVFSGVIRKSAPIVGYIYHNTTQSINNGALTVVALNSSFYMNDVSMGTNRLVCNTAGKYQINGMLEWAFNASGYRGIGLKRNNTAYLGYVTSHPSQTTNASTNQGISVHYELAVGDYIELIAFQDSGGALTLNNNTFSPVLSMARIV